MNKKIFSLILVFTLLISSTTVINASSDIDSILRSKGVPIEIIETMPESMKYDVVASKGELLSWSKSKKTRATKASIPDDEFDLYINVYSAPKSSDGKIRKKVYIYYDWLEIPFMWCSDPFAISWDSDWKPVAGTQYHTDEVRFKNSSTDPIFNTSTTLEENTNTGVGWFAELEDLAGLYLTSSVKSLGGFGRMTIEEKTAGQATSNGVYGKYGHSIQGELTPSIRIQGMSISVSGTYKRATQKDFTIVN